MERDQRAVRAGLALVAVSSVSLVVFAIDVAVLRGVALPEWLLLVLFYSFPLLSGIGGYLVLRAKRVRPRRVLGPVVFVFAVLVAFVGLVVGSMAADGFGSDWEVYAGFTAFGLAGLAGPWGLALAFLPDHHART